MHVIDYANNCQINVLCEWNACNIIGIGTDTKEHNTTDQSYFTC
jgi:hypothetical protein